jgi:hypothetical protein
VRRRPIPDLLAALAVAGLLVAGPAAGRDEPVPGPVRDLYFGETLFQFYQDEHFDALTHLLAARASGRVANHEAESELLLGGLYLHYGQHQRAEDIFNRLLTASTPARVRDRAWFYLGKVRYQRGLNEQALADFARVEGALPPTLAAELPMLKAQALMALERHDEAARLLDDWDGPELWVPYARYNLGVALVRLQRLAEGAKQLDRVGRGDFGREELLDLRDKANLALGYAYLQQSLDGEAASILERVRLNGPFANKALLGAGWADAATRRYRDALTPWLELRNRDLLDSAVQESLLAIPYAYAQLDAHGSAAEGYQFALSAYDTEVAKLDAAIDRARRGGLVEAVLAADDPEIGRWYWELDGLPDTDEARYLYLLVADHRFQEGLRNVRDLQALASHLQTWRDNLGAFDDIVDTRRAAHAEREPRFVEGLDAVDLDTLRARRDVLAARLDSAAADRDISALGTDAQLDQWRRLAAIGADPRLVADPDLEQRHRLLQGALAFELDRDFKYRLWNQRQQLRALDRELARADRARTGAALARAGTPGELDAFSARIAAIVPRIERLQAALVGERRQQEQRLQALAIDTLTEQRDRLAAYRVQAQFALATIYDRAATAARASPAPASQESAP